MLTNFFFAVSFNSLFSAFSSNQQSFEDSWFYTLFSGMDWEALFSEWDVLRSIGNSDSELSAKVVGCAMFFMWMVITLVFVNLFIGIVTDLYPIKRMSSNKDWEVLITARMSDQLVRYQYLNRKKVGEHAHLVAGVSAKSAAAQDSIFKTVKAVNIIKLGIMKASAKLHLLRGADGYRFWKQPVMCVLHVLQRRGWALCGVCCCLRCWLVAATVVVVVMVMGAAASGSRWWCWWCWRRCRRGDDAACVTVSQRGRHSDVSQRARATTLTPSCPRCLPSSCPPLPL
jgi:hypothetical protein